MGATGLTLAFEPYPDPDRCSPRAALTAAVLANGSVAAVLVFGASVANLVGKLELSGFPWHAVATAGLSSEDASEATVPGERTQVLGTEAKRSVGLTAVEGQAPAAPDEVAVGAKTRSHLAKDHMGHLELAA